MATLLIQPHSDDAVLFACYTLLSKKPHIVTALSGGEEREAEDAMAFMSLGLTQFRAWPQQERHGDQETMELYLSAWLEEYAYVYAPAFEEGGHEEHNMVALAAQAVFGDRVRNYWTYRRGYGRSEGPLEVRPSAGWRALKLRAMACYNSQIDLENTRPWFNNWDREWVS